TEATEGETLSYTVSLEGPITTSEDIAFTCELSPLTSSAADFGPAASPQVMAPGQTSATCDVSIVTDAWAEGDETAEVRLVDVSGALAPAPLTLTIVDGNAAPTLVSDYQCPAEAAADAPV